MNRFQSTLATVAAGALMLSATAATAATAANAESTRPGASVPMVSKAVTDKMGTRSTKRVKADERFAGIALPFLIIGAIVTVATVVVVASDSDSRG
jgi:hypothetical protein